jgi:GDSL-like Lipase/Acylhydrolase family
MNMEISAEMKRTILAAAVALALSACGGGSGDPAGVPTSTSSSTPPPTVFIGDSITAYWTSLDTYFPGAVNEGIGGQTCEQMQKRFAADVLAKNPAVVVILCGANDIRYNLSDDQSPLFAMVQAAQSAGAKVVVGELLPNTGWPEQVDNYPEIGQALYVIWNKAIVDGKDQYGYIVADYYDAMLLDGKQNASLFKSDGTHPNAAGYAVMAKVLDKVMP